MESGTRGLVLMLVCVLFLFGLVANGKTQSISVAPITINKSGIVQNGHFGWSIQQTVRSPGAIMLNSQTGYLTDSFCQYKLTPYRPSTYNHAMVYFWCATQNPKYPFIQDIRSSEVMKSNKIN